MRTFRWNPTTGKCRITVHTRDIDLFVKLLLYNGCLYITRDWTMRVWDHIKVLPWANSRSSERLRPKHSWGNNFNDKKTWTKSYYICNWILINSYWCYGTDQNCPCRILSLLKAKVQEEEDFEFVEQLNEYSCLDSSEIALLFGWNVLYAQHFYDALRFLLEFLWASYIILMKKQVI